MRIFGSLFITIIFFQTNNCERFNSRLIVKETIPWSNEKVNELISKLDDGSCYHKEQCAIKWLQKLNFLIEKMLERGSYLQVKLIKNVLIAIQSTIIY
jgi:hypothetical protein